jgi:GxxExxY protein
LERSYEDALAIELRTRSIPFRRQVDLGVEYKGQPIAADVVDLLVFDEVVVELKAVETLREVHRAQVLAYLKAGSYPLGLLLNFNLPKLVDGIVRVAWRTRDQIDWVLPDRKDPP